MATVCAVMVVVCAMFAIKAEQSVLVDDQSALKAQLEEVTKEVLGEATSDPALVRARVENPKRLDPIPRFDAFDALAAISGSIPAELKHEVKRMRIDAAEDKRQGRVELQGSISSLGDRDAIVSQLEAHGCFRQIELGRTNPIPGQDLINFQLEAVVQCPGEVPPDAKKSTKTASEEP
jgi:general secretion pathway protein L